MKSRRFILVLILLNIVSIPLVGAIAPLTVSLTASNTTADAGQFITLTANSIGGVSANDIFTFYFAGGNTVINGNTGPCQNIPGSSGIATCSFTESASTFQYSVNVVSDSQTASANTSIITVNTAPSLTITPSSTSLSTTNTAETFTLTVSGGTGPVFNVQVYNITAVPNLIGSVTINSLVSNSNTVVFNVNNQPGIYIFNSTANDMGTTVPFTFGSAKSTIEVNALVAGQPQSASQGIDLGQSAVLTANPSGGTGIYTYQWYSSTSSSVPRPWNTFSAYGQGILLDGLNSTSWIGQYSGSTVTINTTKYIEGGSSVELHIAPYNQYGAIFKPVSLDLSSAKNLYFWVYINNLTDLTPPGNFGISLYLFDGANYFLCGVQSGELQNGWNPIVIASSTCTINGAPSWNHITGIQFVVALKNSSINHNVGVNFGTLKYNYAGGAFNEAQIILTFDGSWNSTVYNTTIMQINHQTGVAYLVTNDIGNTDKLNGGCAPTICITSNELKILYNRGWDIGSHTVNHANLVTLTSDLYTGINPNFELANSFATLNALGFGPLSTRNTAQYFAYPNGAYNSIVISKIKMQGNYTVARALGYGITQPNLYPDDPYNLSYRVESIAMTPSISPSTMEGYIKQVEDEKGLLVLAFHVIQGDVSTFNALTSVNYSTANFNAISTFLANEQSHNLLKVTNFSNYYPIINGTIISPIGSTNGPTLTVAPKSNAYYYYRVNSGPFIAYSPTAFVSINPVLTATAQPNVPATLNVGQSIPVNALVTGGSGSYTYSWSIVSGDSCPGFTAPGSTTSFAYTPNAPTTTCMFAFTANDGFESNIISTATITANQVTTTSTTSTTSTSTTSTTSTSTTPTTIIQSSGGGGGGGTGGVVGGSFLPTVVVYTNGSKSGFEISNISADNVETLSFNNGTKILHLTVNFITPTSAGITISNATTSQNYTLTPNNPTVVVDPNNYTYYAELTNLTYTPILHSINLILYGQSNAPLISPATPPSTATTTIPPTTTIPSTVTTTIPTTMSTVPTTSITPTTTVPQTLIASPYIPIGIGVAVVLAIAAGIAYSRSTRRRIWGR